MLAAADGEPWRVRPDLPGVAGVVLSHAGRLLQVTGAKLLLIGFAVSAKVTVFFRFCVGGHMSQTRVITCISFLLPCCWPRFRLARWLSRYACRRLASSGRRCHP